MCFKACMAERIKEQRHDRSFVGNNSRLEGKAVSYDYFERWSAPMFKRIADRLIRVIDGQLPRWGAPRLEAFAERARDELTKVSTFTGQVQDLIGGGETAAWSTPGARATRTTSGWSAPSTSG